MWKCITRGLRAPFERNVWPNCTTATTDRSGTTAVRHDSKSKVQLPCPLRLIPCFLQVCQRHISQFSVQNKYQQNTNSSGDKSGEKDSTRDSFRSENINYHQPCTIIGAVGWSGVLVLGWTILQPWYRHHQKRKPFVESSLKTDNNQRYTGLYKLLLNPAFSHPVSNHILPPHVIKKDCQLQLGSSSPSQPRDEEPKLLSPEEAFDEAAEEVRRVHEHVVGEAENRRGVACLSESRNQEAIEHFKIASTFNNAPAAFNLGQCYELGIGTNQDFSKAAHWYKIASDMGHPSAMYNLGVFYAHGWGGLKADSRRAKQLFLTAAARGQSEAQAALNLCNKHSNEETEIPEENVTESFESRLALDFFKMNNINLRFTNSTSTDNLKKIETNISRFRPVSSLPSSSSPSSNLSTSPSSSSSISCPNEHPLLFDHQISTIDESSENYAETSSEDEWQTAVGIAGFNGNSATLYRLAVCYESSPKVDPELILQLYRMAADHGHQRAKQRLKVLEEHYALGTLDSYLKSIKKKSKYSSVSDCSLHE